MPARSNQVDSTRDWVQARELLSDVETPKELAELSSCEDRIAKLAWFSSDLVFQKHLRGFLVISF